MYTRLILLDDIPEIQRAEVGKGIPIPLTAATGGMKGDGYDLAGLPWDFSRAIGRGIKEGWYRYPMLWVHDYAGDGFPLGVVDVAERKARGPDLDGEAIFNPEYDKAVTAEGMYRSPVGGLAGFSVSWEDVDENGIAARASGKKPVAHQLYEVSAVPIGQDALAVAKDGGARVTMLRALVSDIEAALETATVTGSDVNQDAALTQLEETFLAAKNGGNAGPDIGDLDDDAIDAIAERIAARMARTDNASPDDGELARETAARMVAALDPASPDTDADRRREYNALRPRYERLGWTMPEFVPGAELRVMDPDVWRELFVSGELVRVGKEFSAANMTELGEVLTALETGTKRLRSLVNRVSGKGQAEPSAGSDGEGERTADTETDPIVAMLRELATSL